MLVHHAGPFSREKAALMITVNDGVVSVASSGQPTLRRRLKLAILAALDQRISTRYTITGMNQTDTADYIGHHLKFAGRSDTLFSDDAITAIHQASRGYPRAVNNLAVASLIATYAADKSIVDLSATQSAITENSE